MKDIERYIKQAKAGKPVNIEEVPPPVAVGSTESPVTDNSVAPPVSAGSGPVVPTAADTSHRPPAENASVEHNIELQPESKKGL